MNRRPVFWASICALNVLLAVGVLLLARPNVGTTSDRVGYEYVAQNGVVADCPHSIYCYRVLVPSVLRASPLPEVTTWRLFSVLASAATGSLLAGLACLASGRRAAGVLAAILYQLSFGATFNVYDPFTPDAAVYLLGAILALLWWFNRPLIALGVALVGVFAKEAVAVVFSTMALATLNRHTSSRRAAWIAAAAIAWVVLLGFHAIMDVFFGWTESDSSSANVLNGGFLRVWLTDPTLTPAVRLFYLFTPFAFAWLWAALGYRYAPRRLKSLAMASLLVLLLVYVQTPERALASFSFIVVPLAALYLSRLPLALGLLAAVANGLLTARVGLTSELLPPVNYSLLIAACVTAVTILRDVIGSRTLSSLSFGSSRTTSIR